MQGPSPLLLEAATVDPGEARGPGVPVPIPAGTLAAAVTARATRGRGRRPEGGRPGRRRHPALAGRDAVRPGHGRRGPDNGPAGALAAGAVSVRVRNGTMSPATAVSVTLTLRR